MKDNYTHITFLIDRSGSMSSIREAIQGSFNQLVADQMAIDLPCTISLYDFDATFSYGGQTVDATPIGPFNGFEIKYEMLSPENAPEYTLLPRRGTALYDAMGQAIQRTGELLAALEEPERPSKVLMIILTDGEENSSYIYNAEQIKALIKRQRETYNWEFSFIGANIDAILVSRQLGIESVTQFQATADSSVGLMREHSKSLGAYRTGSASYTVSRNIDSGGSAS